MRRKRRRTQTQAVALKVAGMGVHTQTKWASSASLLPFVGVVGTEGVGPWVRVGSYKRWGESKEGGCESRGTALPDTGQDMWWDHIPPRTLPAGMAVPVRRGGKDTWNGNWHPRSSHTPASTQGRTQEPADPDHLPPRPFQKCSPSRRHCGRHHPPRPSTQAGAVQTFRKGSPHWALQLWFGGTCCEVPQGRQESSQVSDTGPPAFSEM